MPLLQVNNLAISFHTKRGIVRAVRDVSFSLERGQTLGIVGESGSGKTVTSTALLGLLPRSATIDSGSAMFDDTELFGATEKTMRRIRGPRIGMVFQDPMSALNPFLRISTQLTEALRLYRGMNEKTAVDAAVQELEAVGLPDASARMRQYPHQFSGGQRQRILIAIALLLRPELLIADEPTTALDVTLQAQILELIKARQKELGTAVIIITHNLGVAATLCDQVMVMYAGSIVERGSVEEVLNRPAHPYTAALKKAIPGAESGTELLTIPGAPPSPGMTITGCPFAPRCEYTQPQCEVASPETKDIHPGHSSACLRMQNGELSL